MFIWMNCWEIKICNFTQILNHPCFKIESFEFIKQSVDWNFIDVNFLIEVGCSIDCRQSLFRDNYGIFVRFHCGLIVTSDLKKLLQFSRQFYNWPVFIAKDKGNNFFVCFNIWLGTRAVKCWHSTVMKHSNCTNFQIINILRVKFIAFQATWNDATLK